MECGRLDLTWGLRLAKWYVVLGQNDVKNICSSAKLVASRHHSPSLFRYHAHAQ